MDKKLTMVAIALLVILIGIGGFLIGRTLVGGGGDSQTALLLDEKTKDLENKNREIQELQKETEQLRKDLEETAKQASGLQTRLDQANRGVSSIQDRLKTATRPAQTSRDTSVAGSSGRPGEAGSYETVRETSVFSDPSSGAKIVAKIAKGAKVNVVKSSGDWLEVRSKHGNPPGYIRRDDAMYMGAN